MSSTYIPVPVEAEATDLAGDAFDYIAGKVPGWEPSPGNLEAWLVEALSQTASELRDVAALVPDSIFAYYGSTILGLPPYEATQATGTTTWTAVDDAGYTVDAGSLVAISPPASIDSYAFEVVDSFTLTPGQTVQTGVTVRALEAGAEASGLTGDVEVLDPLDFIATVTLDAPTTGGTDAEDPDAYLDRLSDLLTLLTPRPILPQDFAIIAQREVPEVARATAIDLYKYDTSTPNTPRCVTVVCIDPDGQPVSSGTKAEVDALLQSMREVNFLVYVGDPTYTAMAVTVALTAYPGYVKADVEARVQAALLNYLHPATWGVPPYGDTSGRSWLNTPTVRLLEVAEVVNETEGVHYITALTIGVAGGTMGTSDVTMSGVAPLPTSVAGDIHVTATVEP